MNFNNLNLYVFLTEIDTTFAIKVQFYRSILNHKNINFRQLYDGIISFFL